MEAHFVGDEETRSKRSQQIKRNFYAKILRQEKKYLPKVIDSRKQEYRRIKLDPRDIDIVGEESDA